MSAANIAFAVEQQVAAPHDIARNVQAADHASPVSAWSSEVSDRTAAATTEPQSWARWPMTLSATSALSTDVDQFLSALTSESNGTGEDARRVATLAQKTRRAVSA